MSTNRPAQSRNTPRYLLFADRVRNAAMDQGLNQTEVSRLCGVTPQSVQRWFSGSSLPRPQHIPDLSKALGLTVEDLIDGIPELSEIVRTSEHLTSAAQPDQESPAREFTLLALATEAMAEARLAYQHALADAMAIARAALIDELQWAGYATVVPVTEISTDITVSHADRSYLLDLRVTLPSPGDTARLVSRRRLLGSGVPNTSDVLVAYAFTAEDRLRFLIVPEAFFTDTDKLQILKCAAHWLDGDRDTSEMPTQIGHYIDNFDLHELVNPV